MTENKQDEPRPALERAWRCYREASTDSRQRKTLQTRSRIVMLGLTTAAAVLAVSSEAPILISRFGAGAGQTLAILNVVMLAAAAYLGKELLSNRWAETRAQAEAIKSQCYRFAAGVSPYDTDAARGLLLDKVEDLQAHNLNPVSDEEARKGIPTVPMLPDLYISERVNDQIGYYERNAQVFQTRLKKLRVVSLALGLVAAILPVISGFTTLKGLSFWTAVLTTTTTAVGSYVYAERLEYLRSTFSATARGLRGTLARWEISGNTADDLQTFVESAELTMSAENTAWMAEITKEEKGQTVESRTS